MISKFLKLPFNQTVKGLTKQRYAFFAQEKDKSADKSETKVTKPKDDKSKKPEALKEQLKTGHTAKVADPHHGKPNVSAFKDTPPPNVAPPASSGGSGGDSGKPKHFYHPSLGDPKVKKPRLQDIAYLEYQKWPNVAHNDPRSAQYVHSERDEVREKTEVDAYNYIIDGIKRDIKLQEEVDHVLATMDRPYKKGIPGVHQNITGGLKDYGPVKDKGFKEEEFDEGDEKFFAENFSNEKRWINQTVYFPKHTVMTSDVEWHKELINRQVTKNFHPDKGYKYDIEVPADQRFPHVADRFGYPEIMGTPFERLMRLEGDIYHPVYLDQPFINVPSPEPHPSLNFEEGEVIYENTHLLEWAKFWNLSGLSMIGFSCIYAPYAFIFKTHLTYGAGYDNLFLPYYANTPYMTDINNMSALFYGGALMWTLYMAMGYSHHFWKDYALKVQYNKDKELVFVTRVSPYCSIEEEVFELQHLEVPPPSVKVGTKDLSSQDKDGLWDLICMASHRHVVMYNEDKYWNPTLRKEFFDKIMNYWSPDIVEGSRLEERLRAATKPKINLGGEPESESKEAKKLESGH
jgi:hypothetical protein